MKKHLFRRVSRGSSNTIITYGLNREKMKQKTLLVLATIIIASWMISTASAQSILVSPPVVRPGETVTISGQTTASVIQVKISNTRTVLDNFNVTVDSGMYSFEYLVHSDAPVDVYTVVIGSDGETTFIVSKMSQEQLSNTIKTLVENAKRQAESAMIQARKQGQTVPSEVRNTYLQGLDAVRDAGSYIQNHNYGAAYESLQEALNLFREVIEYSYGEEVTPVVDPEQERVRVQEIIDQLKRQYTEIHAATQKLKQNGVDVDAIEEQLIALRNGIEEVQTSLDEGKIIEARQMATRLHQLVQQRLTALRQKQAEITKRLAERYQSSLENRVETYLDTFQKLQTIRPLKATLAIRELEALQTRLSASGELLETGNVVTALREMRVTEYRLRSLASTVNGVVTNRLLSRIDELAANLEESTGTDTSRIEKEIEDTKNSLSDYLRERPSITSNNATLTP